MKVKGSGEGDRSLAVFIDFENMGLGFNGRRDRFEIGKVLERIVEKGKIVAKKAYADWSRFGSYTASLHEAAIELIEIPRRGQTGKNSADIRLVVDAVDLAYSKDHIDTFVIVSGDSDFSPLVSKLKELGKHVIGLGLSDATSSLLRDNCDEFIYYEDLDRAPIIPIGTNEAIPEQKRKGFALLLDSLLALRRENKEVIFSSMVKDTMKRKKPSFNEGYYGYRTFSELLEDAQKEGLLELDKHKASGMYIVTRFGLELKGGPPRLPLANGGADYPDDANGGDERRGRRRRGRGRGRGEGGEGVREPLDREPLPREPLAREPLPREPMQRESLPREPLPREPLPREPLPREPLTREPAPRPLPRMAEPPLPRSEKEAASRPVEADRPLGRELVDDFDLLDDIDEIPSYAPRKPLPPPPAAARPAPPRPAPVRPAPPPPAEEPKPRAAGPARPKPATPPAEPAERPARRSGGRTAAAEKPAGEKPAGEKPAPRGGRRAAPAKAEAPPAEPKPAEPKSAKSTPAAPPPPPPKPKLKEEDHSDFGAGLDL